MTIDTIREDHKHCTEDECHAWDRDVIVRSMVMPCHVTTVLADADRLAEALRDANAEIGGCTPTSGGTDGQWCVSHLDYRWVYGSCELAVNISEALRQHEETP